MTRNAKLSLNFTTQPEAHGATWGEAGRSTEDCTEGPRTPAPEQAAQGVNGSRSRECAREAREGGPADRQQDIWAPLHLLPHSQAEKGRVGELLPGRLGQGRWRPPSPTEPAPPPPPSVPHLFVSAISQSISAGEKVGRVSLCFSFACLFCLSHLKSFENSQAHSKDRGRNTWSSELVSEQRFGSEARAASSTPTVLSVRSLSSREGHVQPGRAQLRPTAGTPLPFTLH